MIDRSSEVLKAVFAAISGVVSYDGHSVPVYSFFVGAKDNNYIFIAGSNATPSKARDCDTLEHFVDIEVVNNSNGPTGSLIPVAEISAQVVYLLHNANLTLPNSVFCVISTFVTSQEFTENDGKNIIARKRLTFRFSPNK